ncbi:MAG TPA: dehydrogenase E1 component subunit alpha/beta [Bacteroidota bacterium]|nr:dehydrogenase E1 component subunit alpha/beta [Bacteroidota bacterium]
MTTKKHLMTVHKHDFAAERAATSFALSSSVEQSPAKEELVRAYRTMFTARTMDEKAMILLKQGKIHFHIGGPGHEACQVAAALALRPGHDWAYPYYRDLAFALHYGSTPYEIFLESMHRLGGPSSNGRQMPAHYGDKALRMPAQSSPTGTQFLQAVGTAMGAVKEGTDEIVYVSSGEGATSEGEFSEALNWACRGRYPVVFLIQNNGYAISVPVKDQIAGGSIAELVSGYPNLLRFHVDGTDFLSSYKALREAVVHTRSGLGPSLIEADVVRLFPHSSSDDARKYLVAEELERNRLRDPLPKMEQWLLEEGILPEAELDELKSDVRREVNEAAERAEAQPSPAAETAERNVYSPNIVVPHETEFHPAREGKNIVMVDAINHALHEEMGANPKMLVYGEDVAGNKGGVFTATKGLTAAFGESRAFNSQLAEASILGTAIGLAIRGFKPVVEIQFGDYIWPSFMQFKDELVQLRYRSDGNFSCPVVVRVAVGGYIRGGLYHSQSIEGFFAHMPGLWIAMPSNAADAKGLLKTACREENPVLFCEHKGLYRQGFASTPEPDEHYLLPFGKAKVKTEGTDITVVAWGMMVQRSLEAAKKLERKGVKVEVIDLRTISPWDRETVLTSVKKTGKVLVVHEDTRTGGFGGEIAAVVAEECFRWLDGPVMRVAAKDAPIPFAPALEAAILPQESDITAALEKLAAF